MPFSFTVFIKVQFHKTSATRKTFCHLLGIHVSQRVHLIKLACNSRCFYPTTRYFNLSSGSGNIQIKERMLGWQAGGFVPKTTDDIGRTCSFHEDLSGPVSSCPLRIHGVHRAFELLNLDGKWAIRMELCIPRHTCVLERGGCFRKRQVLIIYKGLGGSQCLVQSQLCMFEAKNSLAARSPIKWNQLPKCKTRAPTTESVHSRLPFGLSRRDLTEFRSTELSPPIPYCRCELKHISWFTYIHPAFWNRITVYMRNEAFCLFSAFEGDISWEEDNVCKCKSGRAIKVERVVMRGMYVRALYWKLAAACRATPSFSGDGTVVNASARSWYDIFIVSNIAIVWSYLWH